MWEYLHSTVEEDGRLGKIIIGTGGVTETLGPSWNDFDD
jgi:hypothetical protein